MSDREKLIELLNHDPCDGKWFYDCDLCNYEGDENCFATRMADHLVTNGVTVQQWIPVKDRLPEDEKPVLVVTKYRRQFVSRYNHRFSGRWQCATNVPITHWMPLPEPPVEV